MALLGQECDGAVDDRVDGGVVVNPPLGRLAQPGDEGLRLGAVGEGAEELVAGFGEQ